MTEFRHVSPKRRKDPPVCKVYGSHKDRLIFDFQNSCGYCGDEDSWAGGYRVFCIDHFVPRTHLKTIHIAEYSNLIYSCFYCNNKKSNDWPTNDELSHNDGHVGYIDPCDDNYSCQFTRSDKGDIIPVTELGAYMYTNLNLGLKRHALIWSLTRLSRVIDKLLSLKEAGRLNADTTYFNDMLEEHYRLVSQLRVENNCAPERA